MSNRFAALGNLSESKKINKAWEKIKERSKTSPKYSLILYELKQHKPWFDEECLHFIDQRKQAKLQGVQNPSQRNLDKLNNVRLEDSRRRSI
jgi:hypothetical protein